MLNKKELAKLLAKKRNTTNNEELENINVIFETIEELLKEEKSVNIVGFGAFKSVVRPPRTLINPKTGEYFDVDERVSFKFSQGKHIKDIFKQK